MLSKFTWSKVKTVCIQYFDELVGKNIGYIHRDWPSFYKAIYYRSETCSFVLSLFRCCCPYPAATVNRTLVHTSSREFITHAPLFRGGADHVYESPLGDSCLDLDLIIQDQGLSHFFLNVALIASRARLLGQSQLSNRSDLPCFHSNNIFSMYFCIDHYTGMPSRWRLRLERDWKSVGKDNWRKIYINYEIVDKPFAWLLFCNVQLNVMMNIFNGVNKPVICWVQILVA